MVEDPLAMHFAHVGGVDIPVGTCAPLFHVSGMAGRIAPQYQDSTQPIANARLRSNQLMIFNGSLVLFGAESVHKF